MSAQPVHAAPDALKAAIAAQLTRSRELKGQTWRHLAEHLETGEAGLREFLRCAAATLEEYRLEILFAPLFTPDAREQAEVAGPLRFEQPTVSRVAGLVGDLAAGLESCPVLLPGGEVASLTLHEVLIERHVRLLRLERAPRAELVRIVTESLPEDRALVALSHMRRKGFTREHQRWFARFIEFLASRRSVTDGLLEATADFLASQRSLAHIDLAENLASLMRATVAAGAFAQKGRMYWSSDVAEHHQFRGQGAIDAQEVEKRVREVRTLETLSAELESFSAIAPDDPDLA
jgi:hypothetical protein